MPAKVKSDFPLLSDSCDPTVIFFFLIIKIYAFGCILIFGWIDIDLDVWVKFDFILILTHVHQKFTFNF